MSISKRSAIPAYYQIAEDIGQKIKSGELKPGEMIASEAQLCEKYDLSRMTVRRGLALLVESGYLHSVQGKGYFVTRPQLNRLVLDFSVTEAPLRDIKIRLLKAEIIPATVEVAEKLGVNPEEEMIYIKRLLIAEARPFGYDCKYLPYHKGKPILETVIEYAELPEMVEKHTDIMPVRSEMMIAAKVLSAEEIDLLWCEPGEPALCIEQVVYAQDNQPVGWGQVVCCSDRYRLKAISCPF